MLSYEQTVLQCLEEVESAVIRLVKSREALQVKESIFSKRNQLLIHTQELYNKGLADSLQLLESRLGTVRATRDLVNQQADSGIQLIALYKALGGSWR
jgi:outer membrane protein TolC